ncbi:ABC transporter ATP-binding protein [Defluviitalea phaphyphila]|uniref:ABC transporter ATP-binding protein n=1 Tax=Defluviitalea phaphyphila TaxID=1473580 RepID=UPI000731BE18|nr:ABC transporter ATP-binding protein [Defluviitalea phaphyphila]
MEVRIKNLTKRFRNFVAVNNLNLSIKDGEFVALLGPSGCGKTTTLLMLAGIYKPDEGEIIFGDQVVNDIPSKDRNIGICFQNYALYPYMTIAQNIAFPLKLRKIDKKIIDNKVKEIASSFHVDSLLSRFPNQISGGQQQRVALARALVKEPKILLLDEPLSNLDSRLRISMRAEIKKIQKDLGITTVFVTHDQTEALSMCDKIAVMNKGVLQDFGTPEELYNMPKNLFIAKFIGNPPMNFMDVVYIRENGKVILKEETFQIQLPEEIYKKFEEKQNGKELILGIRPENMKLTSQEENTIKGEIYVVEPLGRDKLVNVKIGNDKIIKIIASQDYKGNMGDKVFIELDLDNIHLFDKENEKSLRINI